MAKLTVYPSAMWGITQDKYVPSLKLCTRAYYELPTHSQQKPDYSQPFEVEESFLDGDGCISRSKVG